MLAECIIHLNRLSKKYDSDDNPLTVVDTVRLFGQGYDIVVARSSTNPKDKISIAKFYTIDSNGVKTYYGSFFPVSQMLGIEVRDYDSWYNMKTAKS